MSNWLNHCFWYASIPHWPGSLDGLSTILMLRRPLPLKLGTIDCWLSTITGWITACPLIHWMRTLSSLKLNCHPVWHFNWASHTESTVWSLTRTQWNCAIWIALPSAAWPFGPSSFGAEEVRHPTEAFPLHLHLWHWRWHHWEHSGCCLYWYCQEVQDHCWWDHWQHHCITVKMEVSENWELHWEMHRFLKWTEVTGIMAYWLHLSSSHILPSRHCVFLIALYDTASKGECWDDTVHCALCSCQLTDCQHWLLAQATLSKSKLTAEPTGVNWPL